MSFMQPTIEYGTWYEIETTYGTQYLPSDMFSDNLKERGEEEVEEGWKDYVRDFVEGSPLTMEVISGWGVRMSAAGYMDCTEWSVFETEQEAIDYCAEIYGFHWDELDEEEW